MIWGLPRTAALKSIIAPGDLAQRQKQPHVIELAETFRTSGDRPGNRLWVIKRLKGWVLVAGRDRFAALMLLDPKGSAPVEVIESATPEELADLEQVENLYRRPVPDRDKLIAARVKVLAAQIEQKRAAVDPGQPSAINAKPGAPKTAIGEARDRMAAATGTTPEAVRKAVARADAKDRDAGEAQQPIARTGKDAPPPPIDMYGHPLPPAVAMNLTMVLGPLKKAEQLNRQALAALGDLEMSNLEPGVIDVVVEAFKAAGVCARANTPAFLCPYCKGALSACKGCDAKGWVTASEFVAAPAEKKLGPDAPKALRAAARESDRKVPDGDCAHAYRKGGKPTGVCLHCGAGGAETWTEAGEMAKGTKAPPPDPSDAGWAKANGPGSDRAAASDIDRHIARAADAKATARKSKGGIQLGDGPVLTAEEMVSELERQAALKATAEAEGMHADPDAEDIDEAGIPF